jgi:hypothetical protein
MAVNNAAAIKSNVDVVIPACASVPADMLALHTVATLGFCPVKSAERRARADYIGAMITMTLCEAQDAADAAL